MCLFADHLLGAVLRVRPVAAQGGWVILERGWWDIAVDQLRYRMRRSGALVPALAGCCQGLTW